MRRFPPPWTIEELEAGFKVVDSNGQTLAYIGHADPRRLGNDTVLGIKPSVAFAPPRIRGFVPSHMAHLLFAALL
jgi:hypothetical protein